MLGRRPGLGPPVHQDHYTPLMYTDKTFNGVTTAEKSINLQGQHEEI